MNVTVNTGLSLFLVGAIWDIPATATAGVLLVMTGAVLGHEE